MSSLILNMYFAGMFLMLAYSAVSANVFNLFKLGDTTNLNKVVTVDGGNVVLMDHNKALDQGFPVNFSQIGTSLEINRSRLCKPTQLNVINTVSVCRFINDNVMWYTTEPDIYGHVQIKNLNTDECLGYKNPLLLMNKDLVYYDSEKHVIRMLEVIPCYAEGYITTFIRKNEAIIPGHPYSYRHEATFKPIQGLPPSEAYSKLFSITT